MYTRSRKEALRPTQKATLLDDAALAGSWKKALEMISDFECMLVVFYISFTAPELLDRFRNMNTEAGNESYRPVFILMSDGAPTDGKLSRRAGREVRRRSEEGQMNVIPIAIGYVDSTGESSGSF